ncbi:MAG: 6-pyruvoyl-tetrahydropterin synthase-related protein [Pyrinomonadaceae bacterium]
MTSSSNRLPATHAFLIAVISFAVFVPVLIFGFPGNSGDFRHHFQISQALNYSIEYGSFFADWVFQENNGYGAVTVRFYPPLLHYFSAIGKTITGDWILAFYLTFSIWSLIGGLGMYLFANDLLKNKKAASLAASLFLLSPYHFTQAYSAAMLGEFAALSLLPFAFYFTRRICVSHDLIGICGFAASFALIIVSSVPQTVVGAIFAGIYFLLCLDRKRLLQSVAAFATAFALALTCSAFYWLRLVFEVKWLKIFQPNTAPDYDFRNHFLLSNIHFDDQGIWLVNLMFGILTALVAVSLVLSRKPFALARQPEIRNILILLAVASLLMLPISLLIWEHLNVLQRIQFPWRLMSVVTIAACIIPAAAAQKLASEYSHNLRPLVLILIGICLMYGTFSLKQIVLGAAYIEKSEFTLLAKSLVTAKGLEHWLPIWADEHTFDNALQVDAAGRSTDITTWEPELRRFTITEGQETKARVGLLYYPHWHTTLNGSEVETQRSQDGAVEIEIPSGETNVEIKFVEPGTTRVARIVSAASWLALLSLLFVGFRRRHLRSENMP